MMDTQSAPKTIIHKEGRKNGVIHKKWYDHGRTSRTASYVPEHYCEIGKQAFVWEDLNSQPEVKHFNH